MVVVFVSGVSVRETIKHFVTLYGIMMMGQTL